MRVGSELSEAEHALIERVDVGLNAVESGLREDVAFASPVADPMTRYLLDAGGKRFRPRLTLLCAELGQGQLPEVLTAARAIELTHLASLYHDDVMDEATLRRGIPSAHLAWSNSTAILAGDLLFARASKLIAGLGERAIELQSDTFERLCLGQLHETVGPTADEDPIDHYLGVLADKTGSLISLAAQLGAVCAGAPARYEDALLGYGEKLGVAFQLVDDVLDLSPRAEQTGKYAGTDLRAGVPTLPVLLLRERAHSDADAAALLARIDAAVQHGVAADASAVAVPEEQWSALVQEVRAHEVTQLTQQRAQRWGEEAIAALDPLPAGGVRAALERLAQAAIDRNA